MIHNDSTTPFVLIWPPLYPGKDLYACKTALESFDSILKIVGGPNEKKKGAELIERIHIVEDNFTERSSSLKLYGHIKDRAKVVAFHYIIS